MPGKIPAGVTGGIKENSLITEEQKSLLVKVTNEGDVEAIPVTSPLLDYMKIIFPVEVSFTRGVTADEFASLATTGNLRSIVPAGFLLIHNDLAKISTDFLPGLFSEEEEDFKDSPSFLERMFGSDSILARTLTTLLPKALSGVSSAAPIILPAATIAAAVAVLNWWQEKVNEGIEATPENQPGGLSGEATVASITNREGEVINVTQEQAHLATGFEAASNEDYLRAELTRQKVSLEQQELALIQASSAQARNFIANAGFQLAQLNSLVEAEEYSAEQKQSLIDTLNKQNLSDSEVLKEVASLGAGRDYYGKALLEKVVDNSAYYLQWDSETGADISRLSKELQERYVRALKEAVGIDWKAQEEGVLFEINSEYSPTSTRDSSENIARSTQNLRSFREVEAAQQALLQSKVNSYYDELSTSFQESGNLNTKNVKTLEDIKQASLTNLSKNIFKIEEDELAPNHNSFIETINDALTFSNEDPNGSKIQEIIDLKQEVLLNAAETVLNAQVNTIRASVEGADLNNPVFNVEATTTINNVDESTQKMSTTLDGIRGALDSLTSIIASIEAKTQTTVIPVPINTPIRDDLLNIEAPS